MSNLDLLEAVKNRVCDRCKSSFIVPSSSLSNHYKCQNCNRVGRVDDFPEMTVFHQITASPEVLAPEFVYCEESLTDWDIWYSLLLGNVGYATKREAVAATVERLKEVAE
ncbi:MAG: hypothetical protein J6W00_14955 [Lentisphaeria bacterium]|nr:hypothetical protein [Lentisphaeria bacterium]